MKDLAHLQKWTRSFSFRNTPCSCNPLRSSSLLNPIKKTAVFRAFPRLLAAEYTLKMGLNGMEMEGRIPTEFKQQKG